MTFGRGRRPLWRARRATTSLYNAYRPNDPPIGAPMQQSNASAEAIPISGIAHIGIRVHDLERAVRFYALLGFTKTAGPLGPEPVAILDHPSGVELNLILNAPTAKEPNVLMDVPEKHPGITHIALLCPD